MNFSTVCLFFLLSLVTSSQTFKFIFVKTTFCHLCRCCTERLKFPHLVTWSLSFLEKRLQYVRIGSHVSDVRELNAGAPQETITGPNDLKF
jgi:hypothetical protein